MIRRGRQETMRRIEIKNNNGKEGRKQVR